MQKRTASARIKRHTAVTIVAGLTVALLPLAAALTPAEAEPLRLTASNGSTQSRTNPLAGRSWGVYKGGADQAWEPYANATGRRRALLGKIALRPKAKWFGKWNPDGMVERQVHQYIDNSQAGNPNALVQMTIFRMDLGKRTRASVCRQRNSRSRTRPGPTGPLAPSGTPRSR